MVDPGSPVHSSQHLAGAGQEVGAAVTLKGVSKWFIGRKDQTQALSGLDLEVAVGEFVSVIGPSGCGKSTLLRVIGGLVPYESGTVDVIGTTPAHARRTKQERPVPSGAQLAASSW